MQKYKLFLLSKHQLTYKYANPTYTTQKKHTFSTFSTPNYRKVEKKSYLCTQNKQKGNNKTEKNN